MVDFLPKVFLWFTNTIYLGTKSVSGDGDAFEFELWRFFMKILLIGATGQIGYALTSALAKTTHQTSVMVRNKRQLIFPENINVFEAQTFTPDVFQKALHNVDCVIYGVGLPEQFSFDDQLFQRVNYGLFRTFLNSLGESTVRRLVYISTYEVFQAINGVICESHPIADPSTMTPYFKAMTQAYQWGVEFAAKVDLALTTIHPAAVYGGLNTGDGFTNYIENLLNRRFWEVPAIIDGRFPFVHADSLAAAIIQALDKTGAYIVSDQMTSLKEIALTLKEFSPSYVPPTIPFKLAWMNTVVLEFVARLIKKKPVMAKVQLEFIAKGIEPKSDRAQAELDWQPLSLRQGIQMYLQNRARLLAQGSV